MSEADLCLRLTCVFRLTRVRGRPAADLRRSVTGLLTAAPLCAGDRQYADSLRHVVSNVQLDLVVLGVGADGHTASLFPHSPALSADSHTLVTLTDRGPKDTPRRMTMTLPLINRYCGWGVGGR